jgi:hypothetical protein
LLLTTIGPVAAEEGPALPPDPAAPRAIQTCVDLYADYRAIIDSLKARAEACNAKRAAYVQQRYGHHAGRGECARSTLSQCRPLVEGCTEASEAAFAALERCRAEVRSSRTGD